MFDHPDQIANKKGIDVDDGDGLLGGTLSNVSQSAIYSLSMHFS